MLAEDASAADKLLAIDRHGFEEACSQSGLTCSVSVCGRAARRSRGLASQNDLFP